MDHAAPFHCSASVCWTPLLRCRQSPRPNSPSWRCMSPRQSVLLGRTGVCGVRRWTMPFRSSARPRSVRLPPISPSPTAQQSEALTQAHGSQARSLGGAGVGSVHDQPRRPVPLFGQGLSPGVPDRPAVRAAHTIDATEDAHRARVRRGDDRPRASVPMFGQRLVGGLVPFPNPVAQQSTLLTQSTPLNTFNVDALGFGVGTMDHALPFQCSASVVELKDPIPTDPDRPAVRGSHAADTDQGC